MTNPVAMIRHIKHGEDTYDAIMFWCPGCEFEQDEEMVGGLHMLPVTGDLSKRATWAFNGDLERPTLSPSILTSHAHARRPGRDGGLVDVGQFICHSFLRNGIFEFLNDCTHKYKNQLVTIRPLPDWVVKE